MQNQLPDKDLLAGRARLMILQTDVHLSGLCEAIRTATGGMRSQAVLSVAEEILAGKHVIKPVGWDQVLALATKGGISITTYLAKTSKRFPLVLMALEDCVGFKERGAKLKSIIEKPYISHFSEQLDIGAKRSTSRIDSQANYATKPKEEATTTEPGESNFSFLNATKPSGAASQKKRSAQADLAKGLMGIAA